MVVKHNQIKKRRKKTMVTLLESWQKANDDLTRLLAERRVIVAASTKLKIQGIMHDLALVAFRTGHEAGSALRAKQITDICGAVLRETLSAEQPGEPGSEQG
jgi:hypothetical protein